MKDLLLFIIILIRRGPVRLHGVRPLAELVKKPTTDNHWRGITPSFDIYFPFIHSHQRYSTLTDSISWHRPSIEKILCFLLSMRYMQLFLLLPYFYSYISNFDFIFIACFVARVHQSYFKSVFLETFHNP